MPADEYLQAVLLGRDTLDAVDNAAVRALPPGDHFATHLHGTMELIICTGGSITLTLFRTPVTLAPGEYLVVYPQIPHCSDAGPQGCGILQLHFHTEVFQRLFSDTLQDRELYFLIDLAMKRRRFLKQTASPQFYDCALYLKEELEQKRPNYRRMCDLYLFQLILLLSRQVGAGVAPGSSLQNRHLMTAAQYIQQHYAEKITAAQVAELLRGNAPAAVGAVLAAPQHELLHLPHLLPHQQGRRAHGPARGELSPHPPRAGHGLWQPGPFFRHLQGENGRGPHPLLRPAEGRPRYNKVKTTPKRRKPP